jgi:hypothetical protein
VLLIVLLVMVAVLAVALVLREPELRRWVRTVVLRREGSIRAAIGRFQPRDVQRQALALIKERALVSIGYAHLPSDVTVLLNPQDLDRLGAAREHVVRELAEQIVKLDGESAGGEVVFLLAAQPQVQLEAATQLAPGTVEIAPAWLEGTVAVTALISTDEAEPGPAAQWLRIRIDDLAPTEVPVSGRATIGRAPSSNIPINQPSVSRNHAVISVEGEDVTITDLASRNGVEVGGIGRIRPNESVRVEPGDVVHLSRHVRLELISEQTEVYPEEGGRSGGD